MANCEVVEIATIMCLSVVLIDCSIIVYINDVDWLNMMEIATIIVFVSGVDYYNIIEITIIIVFVSGVGRLQYDGDKKATIIVCQR